MKNQKAKNKIKFPLNREMGLKLRQGDRIFIAGVSGLSKQYVTDIFKGRRNNERAVALAKKIINNNEKVINSIN